MFKLKENDVILFQGDSITDGNRGRSNDPNHIHGHGYQYILASEMYIDNLDKNIEVINRGISGNRISDLHARCKEDCIDLKPTVLSILVGINDLNYHFETGSAPTPEKYSETYRSILDRALSQNPDLFIVIMEPFFGVSENKEFSDFMQANVGRYAAEARKIADEYNAVFVPLQDMFDEYAKNTDIFKLLWDGVHPTTGGHLLVTKRWKECVIDKMNNR